MLNFLTIFHLKYLSYLGSGKTYTMFGADDDIFRDESGGIVPQACAQIFDEVEERKREGKCHILLTRSEFIYFFYA
jgi:hypothetical protein